MVKYGLCWYCQEVVENECKCGDDLIILDLVGIYGISNNLSIKVLYLDDEIVIYQFDNDKPEITTIETLEDDFWEEKCLEDKYNNGFKVGEMIQFLREIGNYAPFH